MTEAELERMTDEQLCAYLKVSAEDLADPMSGDEERAARVGERLGSLRMFETILSLVTEDGRRGDLLHARLPGAACG